MKDAHPYDDPHRHNYSAADTMDEGLSDIKKEASERGFIRDTAMMDSMVNGGLFI